MKKIIDDDDVDDDDDDDDDYTLFNVKKCTMVLILQHTDILS